MHHGEQCQHIFIYTESLYAHDLHIVFELKLNQAYSSIYRKLNGFSLHFEYNYFDGEF